jgi:hypothetical protein
LYDWNRFLGWRDDFDRYVARHCYSTKAVHYSPDVGSCLRRRFPLRGPCEIESVGPASQIRGHFDDLWFATLRCIDPKLLIKLEEFSKKSREIEYGAIRMTVWEDPAANSFVFDRGDRPRERRKGSKPRKQATRVKENQELHESHE